MANPLSSGIDEKDGEYKICLGGRQRLIWITFVEGPKWPRYCVVLGDIMCFVSFFFKDKYFYF